VRKRITTGAKNASAIENLPNSSEPPPPKRSRHSLQSATTRSMSFCDSGVRPLPGWLPLMFIGILPRKFWKPECISAQAERAARRACASAGQSCFSGKSSATVSAIARVSQTAWPSTISTGTLPALEYLSMPGTVRASLVPPK
jgi:hypothetical protein